MNYVKPIIRSLDGTFAIVCFAALALNQTSKANAQAPSAETFHNRTVERRAIELAIWGIPLVNYDSMYQAMVRANGQSNQIAYWSHPSNWKNQLLMSNSEVLYVIPFINTKDVGPMVLEIPPAGEGIINGSVVDCWQTATHDTLASG